MMTFTLDLIQAPTMLVRPIIEHKDVWTGQGPEVFTA